MQCTLLDYTHALHVGNILQLSGTQVEYFDRIAMLMDRVSTTTCRGHIIAARGRGERH